MNNYKYILKRNLFIINLNIFIFLSIKMKYLNFLSILTFINMNIRFFYFVLEFSYLLKYNNIFIAFSGVSDI